MKIKNFIAHWALTSESPTTSAKQHCLKNILNKQSQLFQKTKCSLSKQEKEREKSQFFNCLLQSLGVVKHSPLIY